MAHYALICGGRDYADREAVKEVLTFLAVFYGQDLRVMHGGARGADALAHEIALELGVKVKAYPADWKTHGNTAGHIRNAHMADLLQSWQKLGHSVQIVAFPGGSGTKGMCSEGNRREIPVDEMFSEP